MTSYDLCPSCGTATEVHAPPHTFCRTIRGAEEHQPSTLHWAVRLPLLLACLVGLLLGLAGWIFLDGNAWAAGSAGLMIVSLYVALVVMER